MASTANQQQPFPVVPQSLSAGDREMQDYPHQLEPRPTLNQTSYPKPYLGLRARLSQIWINRWTILLILVLVRLLFSIASTESSLGSARREALSACTQVESIGSSMASMPHYMSRGVNDMTATGVEKAVNGLMSMLELSVTAVEEIVIFVIHMMTSTYLCLITLAVSGSLHAAVEIGNAMAETLNKTIDEVTDGIGDGVKTVTDGINSVLDKINFPFGDSFDKPDINLDDQIDKLKSLQVPPEFQEGLQELNKSIPNFEDVQNFTDNIIRLPFQEVKKLIQGMGNYTFERGLLPVPQRESLNFCSEGNSIANFFDSLLDMAYTARKIALGVLIALAILVCIPMAYVEIRRYRTMQERADLFHRGYQPMDVVYLASRPTSSGIGLWLSNRFGSARRQAAVRWAWAYATSIPMLFLLALGLAGLFACLCQYLLLKSIQDKVPELTDQVADFAGKVVGALNNASTSWSSGVNGAVDKLDNEINQEVFSWVNTTTGAVNGTLNAFVDKMSEALNATFGDTILYEPIKEVLHCLIGLKIAGFQKGLTWVSDNAHVAFPHVGNDTFSLKALSDESESESTSQLLADPSGKTRDEVTEAINRVLEKLKDGIITEALISTTLILIWLAISLGGLVYACTRMRGHDTDNSNPYVTDPPVEHEPKHDESSADAAPPSYEYPVNKAAPYTLQPRPFRAYGPSDNSPSDENFGQVDARTASPRPGHARASSHVLLAEPSPLDEKHNPFTHPNDPYERNLFENPPPRREKDNRGFDPFCR